MDALQQKARTLAESHSIRNAEADLEQATKAQRGDYA